MAHTHVALEHLVAHSFAETRQSGDIVPEAEKQYAVAGFGEGPHQSVDLRGFPRPVNSGKTHDQRSGLLWAVPGRVCFIIKVVHVSGPIQALWRRDLVNERRTKIDREHSRSSDIPM